MRGAGIKRPTLRSAVSLFALVAVVVVMTTGIRAYAAEPFVVPSGSMLPTLQIGDRLIANKLSSKIRRGDIVVFRRAPGDTDLQYPVLVKRVIGLPGETISSVGNTILIDGKPLSEPWLPKPTGICAQPTADVQTEKIPVDNYFVMGDCRGDSSDSRVWGTVPVANIIGKATVVVWRHNHPWIHWL